jgi:hypothetical protein
MTTYSAEVKPIAGGRVAPWKPTVTARVNGYGTQQSTPSAVYRNGATYVGWVATNGNIGITKYVHATDTSTDFVLWASGQANGHNSATITCLPDGRIICFYSLHNDTTGVRYRISTNPDDISAWGSQVTLATYVTGNGTAYNNTFSLSLSGKTYVYYRGGDWTQRMRATANGTDYDTDRIIVSNGSNRPYLSCHSNGINRVDFFFNSGNPAQIVTSIYHAYMTVDSEGAESWFTSDGTSITAPATPSNATLVFTGASNARAWNWNLVRLTNGDIWALWTKFVTAGSDHRVMFSKWNGTSWSHVEITPNGGNIDTQTYSDGQACFDGRDPRIVYLCSSLGAANCELQAWWTPDDGATWQKVADITQNSGQQQFTPVSPANHDNRAAVVCFSGEITDFTDFNTDMIFAGRGL